MIRLELLAAAAARALSWPVDAATFRGEWRRDVLALSIVLLIALGAWVRQSQRPRRPHGRCGEESKAQIQRHGRSQSVHRTSNQEAKIATIRPRQRALFLRPMREASPSRRLGEIVRELRGRNLFFSQMKTGIDI